MVKIQVDAPFLKIELIAFALIQEQFQILETHFQPLDLNGIDLINFELLFLWGYGLVRYQFVKILFLYLDKLFVMLGDPLIGFDGLFQDLFRCVIELVDGQLHRVLLQGRLQDGVFIQVGFALVRVQGFVKFHCLQVLVHGLVASQDVLYCALAL